MDHPLPVHVQDVYMVMGKRGSLWQTVLSSTNDLYVARQTVHAANKTGQFERLVISEGKSVNKAPASRWTTIETVIYTPSRFETMMKKIGDKTANGNPVKLPENSFLVGHKQSQNFLLTLACVLSYLNHSAFALVVVAILAGFDMFFMLDNRPLTVERAKFFNNTRNWAFATLNGVLLLVLLLS